MLSIHPASISLKGAGAARPGQPDISASVLTPRSLLPLPSTRQYLAIRFSAHLTPNTVEQSAQAFIDSHAPKIRQLASAWYEAQLNTMCYGANTPLPGSWLKTYKDQMVQAKTAYDDYFKDPHTYRALQALRGQKIRIKDQLVQRQLERLHELFLEGAGKSDAARALEIEIVHKMAVLQGFYQSYTPQVEGEPMPLLEIEQQLQDVKDPKKAQALWRASHGQGLIVMDPEAGQTLSQAFVELVKLRNQLATQQKDPHGKPYKNYYYMKLAQEKINPRQLRDLLDQLDEITRKPYQRYQKASRRVTQARYGVSQAEAGFPWYGQGNLKRMLGLDMSSYFKNRDLPELLQKTVQAMGRDLSDVLKKSVYFPDGTERSSLYSEPGLGFRWMTAAVAIPEDVRIYGRIDRNRQNRMDEAQRLLFHEGFHALDRCHTDAAKLPTLLRGVDAITTESHAMLGEGLVYDSRWLKEIMGLPQSDIDTIAQPAQRYHQAEKLLKIRELLCAAAFEQAIYQDPNQDFSRLWWKLQEKYLGVQPPPDPDFPAYAGVGHFLFYPVYVHDYLLADVIRAQKQAYITKNCQHLLTPKAGKFLAQAAQAGGIYSWEELIERMTGKPLSTQAWAREFADFKTK